MADSADRAWTGSMPDVYERCLAGAVFEPPAADLARRAAADSPAAILELAAGTGTLTRQLTRRLPGAQVTATDLNPAMVSYGAQRVPQAAWQQADALSLPFEDDQFDLVICQFGVMFFGAKPTAFSEVARVLRPDGRFLFSTWDVIERNDFAAALAAAIDATFPADPPTFLTRVPHGYADLAAVAADLRAAGLEPAEQSTVVMTGHADSAAQLATGFCSGTPLRMAIEARGPLQPAVEAIAAQMTSRLGPGPVTGRLTAHVVVARSAGLPGPGSGS
ncbi:MAG: class I SAM-dependent methyltransferase [Streptosporangiaceae bacterium]